MKNKISALILSILIFSFSIVPSFADDYGISTLAVSQTYTIDQMLDQGYISTLDDGLLFTGINIITYVDYLLTDESHTCSTFSNKWCNAKTAYQSTREIVNSNQYKNFYVLYNVNASGFYNFFYIYTNSELFSNSGGSSVSGDYVYFVMNFKYNSTSGYLEPWNSTTYLEGSDFYNSTLVSSNLIMSNTDVYDNNGNLVFEKNIFDEEELPPEDTGSDVTLGGISNIIDGVKDGLTDLKNTIAGFIKDLTAPLEFLKERFQTSTIITGIAGVVEYITNFFAEASDGMLLIKEFFATMPDKFIYFFWTPFVVLLIVAFVGRLLR